MPRFKWFLFLWLALSLIGCGETTFKKTVQEFEVLSRPVIDNEVFEDEEPIILEQPKEKEPETIRMLVNTIGSDNASKKAGPGIYSSTKITSILIDQAGQSFTFEKNVRAELIRKHELLLPKVKDGVYQLKVQNMNSKDILLLPDNNDFIEGEVTIQNGQVTVKKVKKAGNGSGGGKEVSAFGVLYGSQAQCTAPVIDGMPVPLSPDNCTSLESPLVIDLRVSEATSRGIRMSSVEDGVQFDILGNSTRLQMAWIDARYMRRYGFLALPNKRGGIDGIHELFGNNTRGPDKKPASNGFTALAKYDLNGDSYIDSQDAVFYRLQVWTDFVRNGSLDAGELRSLSEYGFTRIDLAYLDMMEQDRYGNQTRMRSAAHLLGGQIRAIFDVWFQVLR